MTKFILFQGTNRQFDKHSEKHHRTPLNDNYQGDWFCFTASKDVAWKYADAARNQNLNRELFFEDLKNILNKSQNPDRDYIYQLCENIVSLGYDEGFDAIYQQIKNDKKTEEPEHYLFHQVIHNICNELDFDFNDLCDLLEYVEGSKYNHNHDDINFIANLLNAQIEYLPHYLVDDMKLMGFDKSIPQPRIIECEISATKILTTNNPSEAKKAKSLGYDLVIYNGDGTVDGEPEYLVLSPQQISLISTTVREDKYIEESAGEVTINSTYKKINLKKVETNSKKRNKPS